MLWFFHRMGSKVLTGSADDSARLWNPLTGEVVRTFTGHKTWVSSVAFSPDGSKVLTGSYDNTAKLWNASTGAVIRTFTGHKDYISSVAFSPDGTKVLTGSYDYTAKLWNAATGDVSRTLEGHTGGITAVAFSPGGAKALTASGDWQPEGGDCTAKLWNLDTGDKIRTFAGHKEILSVAFSPDSTKVLTGGGDKISNLWNAATGELVNTFPGHTGDITAVAFSPDGSKVLTGSKDQTAKLWAADTGKVIRTFTGYTSRITSLAFSPDGSKVLVGDDDGKSILSDAATGEQIRTFFGKYITFSPDGTKVLTGTQVWNAVTGEKISTFTGSAESINSVAFSPDSKIALMGCIDGKAKLWNAATGEPIRTFIGHTGAISSVAFSPDGTKVLTGGQDYTAKLWNASTGELIRTFIGHKNSVSSVAFSPDGTKVLTGSADYTALVWDISNVAQTPFPVVVDIPGNTIIVTDDLQTKDDLLGTFDADSPEKKSLAIRWRFYDTNFSEFDIYVAKDQGQPEFLDSTEPGCSYYLWENPEFGHSYTFQIRGILYGDSIVLDTRTFVVYISETDPTPTATFTPTSTFTNTPTQTFTPTNTPTPTPVLFPVPYDTVVVTDDLQSEENLVGKFDADKPDSKALGIRWEFARFDCIAFHIYVIKDNGADEFVEAVPASVNYYLWTKPEFDHSYRFRVWGIVGTNAVQYIESAADVLFLADTNPTPTYTATFTPTPTFTPTYTLTPTPVVYEIPDDTVIVTDDLQSQENLVGKFDTDNPDAKALAVRWKFKNSGFTAFHVYYVKDDEPQEFIEALPANSSYFLWKNPEFGHSYRFRVWGISEKGSQLIETADAVFYLASDDPTPTVTATFTPTPTVTPTFTPTSTPIIYEIPDDTAIVTDDLQSQENLVGYFDADSPDAKALAIRWKFKNTGFIEFHIYYIKDNESQQFIEAIPAGSTFYLWKNPEFGHSYRFRIWGISDKGNQSIDTAGSVLYLASTDPTPTLTPTLTPTPVPVLVDLPDNTMIVTGDLQSTEDLQGKVEVDPPDNKVLAIRWNFKNPAFTSYHIHIKKDGGNSEFLMALPVSASYCEWKNPEYGHAYLFRVFGMMDNGKSLLLEGSAPVYYLAPGENTPTPTITNTATPAPTATFTLVPTPRPTITPYVDDTPTPTINQEPVKIDYTATLIKTIDCAQSELAKCGWLEIPGGFGAMASGQVSLRTFDSALIPSSKDQKGVFFELKPNTVSMLMALNSITVQGNEQILMKAYLRSVGKNADIAFGAVKGNYSAGQNVDGSLGINQVKSSSSFVDQEGVITVLFKPDSGEQITPFIQVSGIAFEADYNENVWLDRVEIYRFEQKP